MSKRRAEQLSSPSPVHHEPPAAAGTAAAGSAIDLTSAGVQSSIEPLPEQSLGRKRARRSTRTFSWLSMLATVEVQLVLRCLDLRSRLTAARCNKQLYAAASQPFAWPQEQMLTLRSTNDVAELQALNKRVRTSLLRLAPVHLCVQLLGNVSALLCPEIFALSNPHGITVHPPTRYAPVAADFFLPLLRHPNAQQLRSIDVSRLLYHRCSPAEMQQLQTLPHLQSLSLGWAVSDRLATLQPLSLVPSLTHLALYLPTAQQLYSSLSLRSLGQFETAPCSRRHGTGP